MEPLGSDFPPSLTRCLVLPHVDRRHAAAAREGLARFAAAVGSLGAAGTGSMRWRDPGVAHSVAEAFRCCLATTSHPSQLPVGVPSFVAAVREAVASSPCSAVPALLQLARDACHYLSDPVTNFPSPSWNGLLPAEGPRAPCVAAALDALGVHSSGVVTLSREQVAALSACFFFRIFPQQPFATALANCCSFRGRLLLPAPASLAVALPPSVQPLLRSPAMLSLEQAVQLRTRLTLAACQDRWTSLDGALGALEASAPVHALEGGPSGQTAVPDPRIADGGGLQTDEPEERKGSGAEASAGAGAGAGSGSGPGSASGEEGTEYDEAIRSMAEMNLLRSQMVVLGPRRVDPCMCLLDHGQVSAFLASYAEIKAAEEPARHLFSRGLLTSCEAAHQEGVAAWGAAGTAGTALALHCSERVVIDRVMPAGDSTGTSDAAFALTPTAVCALLLSEAFVWL